MDYNATDKIERNKYVADNWQLKRLNKLKQVAASGQTKNLQARKNRTTIEKVSRQRNLSKMRRWEVFREQRTQAIIKYVKARKQSI